MTRRPTTQELVDAAREHLAQHVLPAITDPKLKFQTLVATHVLGVVWRDLERRDAHAAQEWEAFAALLGESSEKPAEGPETEKSLERLERALSDKIRAGEFDGAESGARLRAALQSQVENALEAWNPAFLARVKG